MNPFDFAKCTKPCKDIEGNKCMMLDIFYFSFCTDDMETCCAIEWEREVLP